MDYLPVVIAADYLTDYKIRIIFDNGEMKTVDCQKWINGEIFEPLKDKNYFQRFFVDGWSISWPNGADIAPETLYAENEVQPVR
jgi:hypothetical protein